MPKTFYLTTPIYYVNARPHIGHAYSTIVADVLARRHRLLGDETYFLTGTDEHGQKIERSAAAAGVAPQRFADQVSKTFADLWQRMGITHDQFIRTTGEGHKRGVQKLFRELYERGHIYLSSYTGAYCVSDEAFVDAPIGTPCPDCGKLLEQVTEENFFFRLSAFQQPLLELIHSNALKITPESARNEVLSFVSGPVAAVTSNCEGFDDALKLVESGALQVIETPTIEGGRVKTFYVPGALKDLSISRSSFTWGVPVPEDIRLAAGAKQPHVVYVWLDALANYITALGYGSDDATLLDKFWPADIHLVGKEITRFHCVYWPAFLLAAGLRTPKQVTANGWLLFDNSKMSKSKGNVVRAETILDAFGTLCPPPLSPSDTRVAQGFSPGDTRVAQGFSLGSHGAAREEGALAPSQTDRDLFAADVLRYYLLREIPFGQDGSFSFDSLVTRYNADLANGYGNLVSRTLAMIHDYFDGVIAPTDPFGTQHWHSTEVDRFWSQIFFTDAQDSNWSPPHAFTPAPANLYRLTKQVVFLAGEDDSYTTSTGDVQSLIQATDRVLTAKAPWKLIKESQAEAKTEVEKILYAAAESIRIITTLLYPILPYATARVWTQLGLGDIEQAAREGKLTNLTWGGLQPGTKLGPLGPIFPRADKGLAQTMIDLEDTSSLDNSKLAAHQRPGTDPAAPPRTSSLPEPAGALPVGGSSAHTTGPDATPSHTEAPASGIFAVPAAPEQAPQIAIDDFAKIELRVARIAVAERIPKADKLLRLEVDLGPHGQRQILSGIAEWYTPEELVGRRIVVITNLAPRKMRGLESHGMLLAASDGDHGKPHLATCGDEIALGARLK